MNIYEKYNSVSVIKLPMATSERRYLTIKATKFVLQGHRSIVINRNSRDVLYILIL